MDLWASPIAGLETSHAVEMKIGHAGGYGLSRLGDEDLTVARKRLLQMHFEGGVGHIGGKLSALDALLLLHHEFLRPGEDLSFIPRGMPQGPLTWRFDPRA